MTSGRLENPFSKNYGNASSDGGRHEKLEGKIESQFQDDDEQKEKHGQKAEPAEGHETKTVLGALQR